MTQENSRGEKTFPGAYWLSGSRGLLFCSQEFLTFINTHMHTSLKRHVLMKSRLTKAIWWTAPCFVACKDYVRAREQRSLWRVWGGPSGSGRPLFLYLNKQDPLPQVRGDTTIVFWRRYLILISCSSLVLKPIKVGMPQQTFRTR